MRACEAHKIIPRITGRRYLVICISIRNVRIVQPNSSQLMENNNSENDITYCHQKIFACAILFSEQLRDVFNNSRSRNTYKRVYWIKEPATIDRQSITLLVEYQDMLNVSYNQFSLDLEAILYNWSERYRRITFLLCGAEVT